MALTAEFIHGGVYCIDGGFSNRISMTFVISIIYESNNFFFRRERELSQMFFRCQKSKDIRTKHHWRFFIQAALINHNIFLTRVALTFLDYRAAHTFP